MENRNAPNDELIDDLVKTIRNPQFQGLVKEIDSKPPSERSNSHFG